MVSNIADISPSQLYNRNTWKKKLGSVGLRPPLGSLLRRSNLLPALKTLTLPARGFFLKKKTSSVNSSHPRGFKHGPGYSDALTTRLEALSQCTDISLLTVHFLCDTMRMNCDHREQNSAKNCTDQLLSCTASPNCRRNLLTCSIVETSPCPENLVKSGILYLCGRGIWS